MGYAFGLLALFKMFVLDDRLTGLGLFLIASMHWIGSDIVKAIRERQP